MLANLAMVGLGGAAGACLRHLVVMGSARAFGPGFPWGTLAVNVAGSFLMGIAAVLLLRTDAAAGRLAPLIVTGVLGGFTTFSAFSLDAVELFQRGRVVPALLYMGGSVALSILALLAGAAMMRAAGP